MRHVAIASYSRVYSDQSAGIATAAIPPDADAFDRAQMQKAALLFAPLHIPPVATVSGYCSKTTVADVNRSQMCDAIAHRLVDHASTLLERIVGLNVGARVGWSSDSIAGGRLENAALQRAVATSTDTSATDGCAAAESVARYAVDLGRYGEVGAARAIVVASGKSMAAFTADVDAAMTEMSTRHAASAPEDNATASAAR